MTHRLLVAALMLTLCAITGCSHTRRDACQDPTDNLVTHRGGVPAIGWGTC